MLTMDKKIASLLNVNLRVIIPEFGAFIITQQQPRVVVFNDSLKNNDGLLIDYIVKTEGIERDVALQLLSDYTSQAGKQLETGGTVVFEGIGKLHRERGRIVFTPEEGTLTEPPSDLHVPSARLPQENVAEPTLSQPVISHPVVSQPVVSQAPARFNVNSALKWVAVFLVANLLVLAFFMLKDNNRKEKEQLPETLGISDPVIQQLADSMMAAVADTSVIYRDEAAVSEEAVSADSKVRYYIIAGCFRDEANADQLVRELKIRGLDAEKFGKIGDLFAVSYASFDERQLAEQELAKVREESFPDAWITQF